MPRIADYAVISDNPVTIRNGGDIDHSFTFNLEAGFHRGSRSILAYVLYVDAGASPITYRVTINGSTQINHSLNESRVSTLHEVIGANVLNRVDNTIEFRITNGNPGTLQFMDVVLLYQRDV